ncbi:MAG: patatin-like phospholipase family protein [Leptospirales bacterium]|nr:patatin-like phospholipase family protein [Leptospirales bacterium]
MALGSGAARGWAHIGILRSLERANIPVHVVAGCSAGAVIGAYFAAQSLASIESFAVSYKGIRDTFRYMDFAPRSGGLVAGRKFLEFMEGSLTARTFSDLKLPFGVIATDLVHMEEVHILEGPLLPAIRASVAVPGFLSPLETGTGKSKRQLVDGGLLNPVPVNLARQLGADIVIAVDLNSDKAAEPAKSMAEIMARSVDTMRERHKALNFGTHPPDVLIEPVLPEFGFFDYHKTKEAIERGQQAAARMIPEIQKFL